MARADFYPTPISLLDARYFKLDASNDPITGALVITPTANGLSILNVTNAAGTSFLNVDTTNGRVGIGTTAPTNLLSLGGNTPRTFWIERHTNSNTAGSSLTIQAGGSTSGSTDKAGGQLALKAGFSTGTNSSSIILQTADTVTSGGVLTVTLNAGSAGYTAGDILVVTGGDNNARITVNTVNGVGLILTFTVSTAGATYTIANTVLCTGGTGTGASFNITVITGTNDNTPTTKLTINGNGSTSNLASLRNTASGATIVFNYSSTYSAPVNSSSEFRTYQMGGVIGTASSAVQTYETITSINQENDLRTSGLVANINGLSINTVLTRSNSVATTSVTTSKGINITGYSHPSTNTTPTTITNQFGIDVNLNAVTSYLTTTTAIGYRMQNTLPYVSLTTLIGMDIHALTRAATNIGIRIAAPSGGATANYALQLSDTGGTAAGGITFGTDVTLYRSATSTLKTDAKLIIGTEVNIVGDLNHDGSNIGFFGTAPTTKQTALTPQLTTLTFTAPSTPDYALQDITNTTPYGFLDAEELRTFISVVANLQTRISELETKIKAYGLLA